MTDETNDRMEEPMTTSDDVLGKPMLTRTAADTLNEFDAMLNAEIAEAFAEFMDAVLGIKPTEDEIINAVLFLTAGDEQ